MMEQYQQYFALLAGELAKLGIVTYALLLMSGGLCGYGPKWANGFALWTVKAPFRLAGRMVFGKPKKKKKKKKKSSSWF